MEKVNPDSRLMQLQAFLEEDPNDPFLLYALATEYQPTDVGKALVYFEQLLANHPDYLATYYQVAHLYAELGREEQAKQAFEKGIAKAKDQKQAKTEQELQNAYQNYLFEIED